MKDFLEQTIREAGDMAKKYFYDGVSSKTKVDPADLVTKADIAISDFFVERIQAKYPGHHIHTEERPEDINAGAEYEWVIDPIDGTRNFARKIPMWCIIVALLHHKETIMGAVYQPISNQFFFAAKSKGAWLNEEKLAGAVTQTEIPFSSGHMIAFANRPYADRFHRAIDNFLATDGRLSNFSTMFGACFVASGGIHFFADNAGYDHDYLAPALICLEAGMTVSDSDGQPWVRGRRDIVIANPALHPKVLALFR